MSGIKRLFISGLFVNLLVMAVNFSTGVMSARFLGPSGRGELAAVTQWTTLIIGLFALGIPGAVIYLGKTIAEKREELLGAYLVIGFLSGLAGMAIGQVVVPHLLSSYPKEVVVLTQVNLLIIPLTVLTEGLSGTLQSLNKFRLLMIQRLMVPFGVLLIIVILTFIGSYDVKSFVIVNMLWSGAQAILVLSWVLRYIRPKFIHLWSNIRSLLGKGIQIYGQSLVTIFGGSLDQIVISLMLSTYYLGLYTVAVSTGFIIPSIIIGSLYFYLWPKLMDLSGTARIRQAERTHSILFYATLGACSLAAAAFPFLMPLVYGHEFAPAVIMGVILLFISPIRVCSNVLSNFLSSEGCFIHVSGGEVLGLGLSVGSMFVLMPLFGSIGAVLAVVTATMGKWLYLLIWSKKRGIEWKNLFVFSFRTYLVMAQKLLSNVRSRYRRGQVEAH
ncbi:oligosaccharide flippase family protein [Gorillibacterium massiliense]|uniref:oligosaccharide flippase family protein n=1 Tax=Gorillibacterium massiliense TaxID=1280390 RepID=UPI000594477B|nr:oligosaccharide flippase family protein [Gorillibacterium massiliense]